MIQFVFLSLSLLLNVSIEADYFLAEIEQEKEKIMDKWKYFSKTCSFNGIHIVLYSNIVLCLIFDFTVKIWNAVMMAVIVIEKDEEKEYFNIKIFTVIYSNL